MIPILSSSTDGSTAASTTSINSAFASNAVMSKNQSPDQELENNFTSLIKEAGSKLRSADPELNSLEAFGKLLPEGGELSGNTVPYNATHEDIDTEPVFAELESLDLVELDLDLDVTGNSIIGPLELNPRLEPSKGNQAAFVGPLLGTFATGALSSEPESLPVQPGVIAIANIYGENPHGHDTGMPISEALYNRNKAPEMPMAKTLPLPHTLSQSTENSVVENNLNNAAMSDRPAVLEQIMAGTSSKRMVADATMVRTEPGAVQLAESSSALTTSTPATSSTASGDQLRGLVDGLTGRSGSTELSGAFSRPLVTSESGFASSLSKRIMIMHAGTVSAARMQLEPKELGKMDIHLKMHSDVLDVSFHVQQVAAKDIIEQQLSRFRSLAEQGGLTLGDVDVSHSEHKNEEQESSKRDFPSDSLTMSSVSRQIDEDRPVTLGIIDAYI
ncbi:MAG: flagellar hook-length control protein FliK [Pseudomonadales bacterium]|nr:flagellar hook-length control protein FliK [Pseudomonadales bacterium]